MPDKPEKRRLGPFELQEVLGVGGMGIVYKAVYVKTGQHVAVKVLSPDLMADAKVAQRFEREMAILKKLKHPHIVQYYGGSTSGTQRFYAMELVRGGSLEQELRTRGPRAWEEVVEYGLQIAQALEHAHGVGIVHRDLKPANLLLTRRGVLKLSDFGIARDTQCTALTAAGKTLGTTAYMAPEQITGKHPITARTDLYALGCVLFQLLSGRTPFESETQPEMLFKHIDEEPPSVREFNHNVPVWLDQLIDELLEKEPADRPYDALAVQVKLEEVKQHVADRESVARQTAIGGGGITVQADRDELTRILGKKKTRKRKKSRGPLYERTWFLSLCLLALVGLVTWGVWPRSEAELYAELQPLMQSHEPGEWYGAEPGIQKLLARFPTGEHATEAQGWLDRIAMDRAEKQAELRASLGRDPDSHAERLYLEARQYERFGDRLTALSKYEGIPALFDADAEARPYVNLSRRQAQLIKDTLGQDEDPMEFVRQQIAEADALYLNNEKVRARSRWQSIVSLYESHTEFESLVEQARIRVVDPDAAVRPPQSDDAQQDVRPRAPARPVSGLKGR